MLIPLVIQWIGPQRMCAELLLSQKVLFSYVYKILYCHRVMSVVRQKGHCKVRIGDMEIEQVNEMKYLGVMISSDGNMEKEVEARIRSAVRMFGGMSEAVL